MYNYNIRKKKLFPHTYSLLNFSQVLIIFLFNETFLELNCKF
jgi:hypothetical protein